MRSKVKKIHTAKLYATSGELVYSEQVWLKFHWTELSVIF